MGKFIAKKHTLALILPTSIETAQYMLWHISLKYEKFVLSQRATISMSFLAQEKRKRTIFILLEKSTTYSKEFAMIAKALSSIASSAAVRA